jgi:ADP-heptose:LPS heptosyltransferase
MIDSVIEKGMIPVLLGNKSDNDNYWSKINIDKGCINYIDRLSLKDSVSMLNQCDYFLSNDTGLYHVAGALKKRGLVMWYKTDFTKNKCLFDKIEHCINKNGDEAIYKKAIDNYIGNS